MKNLFTTLIIFTFILIFNIALTSTNTDVEVVIQAPELNNRQIVSKVIDEFNRLGGVSHVEAAIATQTMMIIYDSKKLSNKTIRDIFLKWGCGSNIDISYGWIN